MRTTIDGAGRLVLPKPLRDAMGLTAGREVDVVFTDGHIEIEIAPVDVVVTTDGHLPRAVPRAEVPELSDDDIRTATDAVRR